MKYRFYVFEQLATSVEIEADSKDDAYAKGQEMYGNEEIVLCSDDFVDVEFVVQEAQEDD